MGRIKRHVYIIRHGETEYGKEKRFLGHTDCSLSESGIESLKATREYFLKNKIEIDSVYSSDLKRCRDTAKIVFPDREVTFLKELREINMGIWDGLTFDEVKKRYPEDYKKRGENISEFTPTGGESFKECRDRALKIFNQIISETYGNVAIFSHAGFIRALLTSLLNIELNDIFKIKQDYECINIISVDKTNIIVESVNINNKDLVKY